MRRTSTSTDSLDLLLGPMCNTFGILVLVACITALLAGQSGSPNGNGDAQATTALEQRRVAVATRERDALLAQLKTTTGASSSAALSTKASEIQRLQELLKALQQHTTELEKHLTQEARTHAADPGADLHQLNGELHAVKLQQQELNNTGSALAEQMEEGQAKIKHLENEKAKMVEARTIRMRFPKEHSTSRTPSPIIIRYGKIYPVTMPDGSFNPSVKHTPAGPHSVLIEPIDGLGWAIPANNDDLLRIFDVCKSTNSYFSLYAYPDSYQVCRDLRQMIADHGVEFGLKPEPSDMKMVFGSEGSAPPTL